MNVEVDSEDSFGGDIIYVFGTLLLAYFCMLYIDLTGPA